MDRKRGHLPIDVKDAVDSLIWMKIVGVGDSYTGKTSLIKHFCESKFSTSYQPTVGVDYGFKIQRVEEKELRVHLWDLSGSAEYLDVRNELYTGTHAAFIVYDVGNQKSFDHLDSWLKEVTKYTTALPEIAVVANKVDQGVKRVISSTDGKRWATARKLMYFETSASTGEGVEKMFVDLLETLSNKKKLPLSKS